MTTSVSTSGPSEDTTVFVSGSSFCMVPSLYQKVEKLRWQKRRGFPHLNANADVFELLLQFLMFGKLPETTGMTARQASELLKMIEPLDNVHSLVEHVKIVFEAEQQNKNKSSSFLRRRLSSMTLFKTSEEEDGSSHIKAANSIDLFDTSSSAGNSTTSITTTRTEPTMLSLSDDAAVRPPAEQKNTSDLLDLFGFLNDAHTSTTASLSKDSIMSDDHLPVLQVADSTDSSVASTTSRTERKVSFSVERSTSVEFNPLESADKLVSPYDNQDTICATSMKNDSAASSHATFEDSSSFAPPSSSSFRLSNKGSTTKSLRNLFQKLKGGNNDVSRTHAEWCSSEYVL